MNILSYYPISTSIKFLPIIGLLLAAGTAAAAAIQHFSNFAQGNVFSIMQNVLGNFLAGPVQYMKTTITVKNTTIVADLALTPDQQSKGLSGRQILSENQGMLFVMETPGMYGFWMKEMKFPLDIFWLDKSGKAVYIKENLQPCPTILNCPTYTPNVDSLYVLETVAGFAHRHEIAKGTQFSFRLPGT